MHFGNPYFMCHLTPPAPLSTLKGVERGEREDEFSTDFESLFFFPLSMPLSMERGPGGEERGRGISEKH